jgi:hypothetical protein
MLPKPVRFSGSLISRTLGRIVMPSGSRLFKGAKTTGTLMVAFVVVCFTTIATSSMVEVFLALVGVLIVAGIVFATRNEISYAVKNIDYSDLGVGAVNTKPIVALVCGIISGAALGALVISLTWGIMWQMSVIVSSVYALFVMGLMAWAYRKLYVGDTGVPSKVYHVSTKVQAAASGEDLHHVPVPVYNVVGAPLDENRLCTTSSLPSVLTYPLAHEDEVGPPPVLSQITLRKEPKLHVEPDGRDEGR